MNLPEAIEIANGLINDENVLTEIGKQALSLLISECEHAERKVDEPTKEEMESATKIFDECRKQDERLTELIAVLWVQTYHGLPEITFDSLDTRVEALGKIIATIHQHAHITLPDAETAAKKYTEIREEVLGELRASNRGKEMINKVMITDEELDKESMRRYHQWLEQGGKG